MTNPMSQKYSPQAVRQIIDWTENSISGRLMWNDINHMVILEAWSNLISTMKDQVSNDANRMRICPSLDSALDVVNAYEHRKMTEEQAYIGLWSLCGYIQGQCPKQSKINARRAYMAL